MNTYNIQFLLIILIFFIYFYVKSSLKTKDYVEILQGDLVKITDNTLYEKQPIIINDKIIDAKELLNSLFKYQYSFVKTFELEKETELFNTHKFMILHNISENYVEILITPPTGKHPPIELNLPPHNVIILPYKWSILSNSSLDGILLNDFIYRFFHFNTN